jgi:gliding motility-associated-like protein
MCLRTFFTIAGLAHSFLLMGQSLYNNTIISVRPNTILFVDDSLVNNGTIINNGDMQIGGSWINNSQYNAGQGEITFNSDLPQVINHNDQSFSKLTISGGGEKIFGANITIENELDLSEGILISDNDAVIIVNDAADITGGSDDAHIVGKVYHKGAGSKTFPLGNGQIYLPVTLTNITGPNAEVGVALIEPIGQALKKANRLTGISTKRYWQLDVVSGSVEASKAILPVRDETILAIGLKPVVAQAKEVSDEFQNLGEFDFELTAFNGFVTSNDPVSLPLLAVATVRDDEKVFVYNALSPNGDGLNDHLRIDNIESFPDNKVTLFNRWGDKVFEMIGYDNNDDNKVFKGRKNIGGDEELVTGTYFYSIERNNGLPAVTGFFSIQK